MTFSCHNNETTIPCHMPDGKIDVPPYYDMNKAEDGQSSHIIIITSATNSATFKH